MELLVIVFALGLVYAVKAVAMLHWRDEEVAKNTSFSWTKPGVRDEVRTAAWAEMDSPRQTVAAVQRPARSFVPSAIVMPKA